MELPIDTSGSKNAVQAVGSSTSYGKRYTAQAILNLRSRGEDDDGKSGGGKPVDPAQPPSKSSASLKKAGADGKDAWARLIEDLRKDFLDCNSEIMLGKLRSDYRARARDERWPRAWLDALGNEFDTFEEQLLSKSKSNGNGDLNSYGDRFSDEVPF